MRAVKASNTGPELRLRRGLWAAGYRYRLQGDGLPGRPDLIFPGRRLAVFVHGCFWHGHACARGARLPKSNAAYWTAKIERNRLRDGAAIAQLAALGWRAVVVWECTLKNKGCLPEALLAALSVASTGAAEPYP